MNPATPRPASTVVLIRPDFRVLLIQRSARAGFFGGAFAFPGGRVEAEDVAAEKTMPTRHPWETHRQAPAGLPLADGDQLRLYRGFLIAACREVNEEVGIDIDAASLVPWSRWVTPEVEPKRYDTLFFLASVSDDAEVALDGHETTASRWLSPSEALASFADGAIFLPPPTAVTLFELDRAGTFDAAVTIAASAPIPEVMPVAQLEDDKIFILLPGDPRHPQATVGRPWPPAMPTRIQLGPG
jgi:8-oxo-dGTP pyrophosphatase MutT (NUDIX family)